jgi:hypothetical protein
MEHAGIGIFNGVLIAAIVIAISALITAVCRLERAFKTWDRMLSEVAEQRREQSDILQRLSSETPDSAVP